MICYASYQELDALGETLAYDYMKKRGMQDFSCMDIDGFAADYLKLKVVYESFAEKDKSKLGFFSNGMTPLRVMRNNDSSAVIFPKDTIVLERYLLRNSESARRRFILAHEAAHKILEQHVPQQAEALFYTEFDDQADYSKEEQMRMLSLWESYANRLGAAVIMPEFLIERSAKRRGGALPVVCYDGGVFAGTEKMFMQHYANDLGVSYSAMVNRFRELDLLKMRPLEEYITNRLGYGL